MTRKTLPPSITMPTTAGSGYGPRDGMITRPWWWFDDDFLASIGALDVRGVAPSSALSERDEQTLISALAILRAARRKLRSGVPAQVRAGVFELASIVAYLSGLYEGKNGESVSGYLSNLVLSQDVEVDLDQQLDALEADLVSLTAPTRGPVTAAIRLARGLGLMYLGYKLQEHAAQQPD